MGRAVEVDASFAEWVVERHERMTALLEERVDGDWMEADDIARSIAEEAAAVLLKALESPAQRDPKGILDPKGNAVLMTFPGEEGGRTDALLFRGGSYQPFVHAWGYDAEAGDWRQGRYFSDPCRAYLSADPLAIEGSAVWWRRADYERALEENGVEAAGWAVDELIGETRAMGAWRDRAIALGNEIIEEAVREAWASR